ncbi:MAG TPA: hypothetical protein PLK28_03655 [Candidatus Rifleibacterium sp.]|nr:hypothetical protein [Candidatus Rifleibacterium sp.]
MKKITRTILLAVLLVMAFSGFKTVENRSVEILDCQLTTSEANLKILPGTRYRQNSVSLRVAVHENAKTAAEGFRKVELLQIPAGGITFRVPLSKKLNSGQSYKVAVMVDEIETGNREIQWTSLKVQGTSSDDFFSRKFRPITEPANLRNQISARAIRSRL